MDNYFIFIDEIDAAVTSDTVYRTNDPVKDNKGYYWQTFRSDM